MPMAWMPDHGPLFSPWAAWPPGGTTLSNQKKQFVAALLADDGSLNAGELSRAVREKFGKGLNLMHVRRLQDAHAAGTFERVWDELFAAEDDAERSAEGLKRSKKSRGERRRKTLLKGRRDIDADKIVLREFPSHLVAYRTEDGTIHNRNLDSRKRAEALVRELLDEGTPPEHVAYFRRSEVEAPLALAA
jgi:hypothetical protein